MRVCACVVVCPAIKIHESLCENSLAEPCCSRGSDEGFVFRVRRLKAPVHTDKTAPIHKYRVILLQPVSRRLMLLAAKVTVTCRPAERRESRGGLSMGSIGMRERAAGGRGGCGGQGRVRGAGEGAGGRGGCRGRGGRGGGRGGCDGAGEGVTGQPGCGRGDAAGGCSRAAGVRWSSRVRWGRGGFSRAGEGTVGQGMVQQGRVW